MDSDTDLQNHVRSLQEKSQPTSPHLDGRSPATIAEDTTGSGIDAGDLKKQRNKELRALGKTFGNIPGVPIFTQWKTRQDCCDAAVHRAPQSGICGGGKDGAVAVALSDGYEDNVDQGDVIIYTGSGGKVQLTNTHSKKRHPPGPQTWDQSWDSSRNKALLVSRVTENPVRVVRSSSCPSKYAPLEGCRYDGLYKVTKCWTGKGRRDTNVCRCRLERLPGQPPIPLRPSTSFTSERKRKLRLPTPTPFSDPPDETDLDIGPSGSGLSPAQSAGSTG